nr:MAG TPA: hypothetical protein [Caudoviricetes sp.]
MRGGGTHEKEKAPGTGAAVVGASLYPGVPWGMGARKERKT